ncbi:hypothetical protein F66182_7404 [Fusarium sp. NRRL 66182]|nr:hypothetical protein F66182_7404 [Fusarium sp. NRRL 66182]
MRLGMGFNSYTQTMCIDNAVEVTNENKVNVENPSQVVTYSSKFVEHLSDIVSTMKISYSNAIKKGTIEVSGNGNSIDEDKIKASDINLVIGVQVINQTTTLKDTAQFKEMKDITAGSPEFNEAFGDCYISGFIEGGDFSSIISMRCLDRSKKNSVITSIKKMTKTNQGAEDFSMDAYSIGDSLSGSSALKDTETTISVNWKGGGQIKDAKSSWDINSVYEAAAAFPSCVAKTPQKTWAILTKYKANRTFNEWARRQEIQPLEYDAVISYTADLFNNFMEYKQLVKRVQDTMAHREQYITSSKPKAIPLHTNTLVAVRTALRNEMNKIVEVVDRLSKNPHLLAEENSFNLVSNNDLVREIIQDAISSSSETRVINPSSPPVQASGGTSKSATDSSSTGSLEEIRHSDAGPAPAGSARKKSLQPTPKSPESPQDDKIDLGALIAPEVWADVLPVAKEPVVYGQKDDAAIAAAASVLPPPPPKNDASTFLVSHQDNKLKILAAVCGIQDVTETLQNKVKDDATLKIPHDEIDQLAKSPVYDQSSSLFKKADFNFTKNLSFIYQYGTGPMRLCTANFHKDSREEIEVTRQSTHVVVKPGPWSEQSLSLIAVLYGGKVYTQEDVVKRVEDRIRESYNSNTLAGVHSVRFDNTLMGEDPWGNVQKTGVIFFQGVKDGRVRAAVGLENEECILSDQPQLTALNREVGRPIVLSSDVTACHYSCTFDAGTLDIEPNGNKPFLTFSNGIKFTFQLDCNFAVYDANNRPVWASRSWPLSTGRKMKFLEDGNLCTYSDWECNNCYWNSETNGNYGAKLVLSDTEPWVAIYSKDGERVSWKRSD